MLKHAIAHRSNSSIGIQCSPPQGGCSLPLTSPTSFVCSSFSSSSSRENVPPGNSAPCCCETPTGCQKKPAQEEGTPKEDKNNNDSRPSANNQCQNKGSPCICNAPSVPQGADFLGKRPSLVEKVNNLQDAHPRPLHEYDLIDELPTPGRATVTPIGASRNSFSKETQRRNNSAGTLPPHVPQSPSSFPLPPSRGGSFSVPEFTGVSRSCTLPRREPFLKEDLRRSSFRSNSSVCSSTILSSAASCSSLSSCHHLASSRSTSTASLSETVSKQALPTVARTLLHLLSVSCLYLFIVFLEVNHIGN